MYDHCKQYRCTIIRGKSQKEMDDLLPAYAKVKRQKSKNYRTGKSGKAPSRN